MTEEKRYLIISGEGDIETEYQALANCDSLEEANRHFDNFKTGDFAETYLYIYEAKLIREE